MILKRLKLSRLATLAAAAFLVLVILAAALFLALGAPYAQNTERVVNADLHSTQRAAFSQVIEMPAAADAQRAVSECSPTDQVEADYVEIARLDVGYAPVIFPPCGWLTLYPFDDQRL